MAILARSFRLKPRSIALLEALARDWTPGANMSYTQTVEAMIEAAAKTKKVTVTDAEVAAVAARGKKPPARKRGAK